MTVEFTAQDKFECVEREIKQRQHVYPRRIADGKMTADFARRQIELMEAIAADYRYQAERERLL